jgi:quaternary ammonium compound-resistance protein SugE
MSWIYLTIAGLLEIGWAIGLKYTDGFSKLTPSILTLFAMGGSFYFLSQALKELPIGTAYGVWVGIGSVGAAVLGIFLFNEAATAPRLFFLGLMIVSLIGLKMTA